MFHCTALVYLSLSYKKPIWISGVVVKCTTSSEIFRDTEVIGSSLLSLIFFFNFQSKTHIVERACGSRALNVFLYHIIATTSTTNTAITKTIAAPLIAAFAVNAVFSGDFPLPANTAFT